MTTPHRRGVKPLWFGELLAEPTSEPSLVICPECGSRPHVPTAFCTRCGRELLIGREMCEPLPVGTWMADSTALSELTTEPIQGIHQPAPQSTPVHRSSQPTAHHSTPVKEMVGSERAEWIDRVWCSAAGVVR
jgi:DNA-directed RNA polymerase subunit RPC12/RpoP